MPAVATDIIVRYLTGDEPEQFAKARALIDSEDIFVCTTVLLETEWVLRSAHRFDRARVIAALTAFAGLPCVILEDTRLAAKALDWLARGMDFADALHLGKANCCEAFVSFDQQFAAVANPISKVKVRGAIVGHDPEMVSGWAPVKPSFCKAARVRCRLPRAGS